MSSLLLLNGSPRGASSNSMKMLSRVAEGWQAAAGADSRVETLHLARQADFARAVDAFGEADAVVIGMPLYADAMPSLVKSYFEQLSRYVALPRNPRLGFLVQCGFVETLHCRPVEHYFEKLARRLGSPYAGTIARGNGESLRSMPDEASKKLWANLVALGGTLAREGEFEPELLHAVAGLERLSAPVAALLKPALVWPLPALMWDGELKRHGAFERRNARPYGGTTGVRLQRQDLPVG